ncbi:hypothetical protein E1B03_25160 [Citrobacter arsenatis]|uniref:Uncharacterized protein n=1 Tax=Citrobacter arsenatis TaxID=2546350 RepID=A0A4P6WU63_9ENTR|nr:hypothetical protein E1B03_25160 [Citrobacter arsenatis]
MNCNITRILSNDARPGTVSLYCSQILSHANCIAGKALRRMALRLSGLTIPGRSASLIAFNYSTETFSKWCLPNGSTT